MKLILVVLLCYLLTVAVKSEEPVETAYEDPEDELDELEEWELDDPVMDKPTSDEVSQESSILKLILQLVPQYSGLRTEHFISKILGYSRIPISRALNFSNVPIFQTNFRFRWINFCVI